MLKNGFSGGYLVQFNNGTPTEEQKKQINDKKFDQALNGNG